jgi:DNA invertase Pin-like site-specific DNA recombinase
MQRAGAGIRSLAEPFLDTTSDFAKIIFAILGVASKLERALMSKDRRHPLVARVRSAPARTRQAVDVCRYR